MIKLFYTMIAAASSTAQAKAAAFAAAQGLLFAEGLAVGALIHGGICFMGADLDAIQAAVVLGVAVISALSNGTFDTFVGMTAHT